MFRGPIYDLFGFIRGEESIQMVIISFFSVLVIIMVLNPIHECAHALTAKLLGDDTAEKRGRVTLNPFAHIDPMGAVLMFLCRFGWADPVPVDLRKCRKVSMRTANILVSLAGPVSNILMALVIIIITKLIWLAAPDNETMYIISMGLYLTARISLNLAVFNLIPIPPLDGYHVLSTFLSPKAMAFVERNAHIIRWVMLFLLVGGLLSVPLSYASNGLLFLLDKLTFFLG
ncbi:MAG: site-2 protease family protein [Oscillospiraceae bacterium]|nr:site-2 protease family protein [Oscillospiraceae bacterium]